MLGTTLAKVTLILKSELGASLSVGTADDQRFYQMIETQQEWFASMYDWNVLRDTWDASITPGLAGRFPTLPATDYNGMTVAINFDRPVNVFVKYSDNWRPVSHGIGIEEMNVFDSDQSEAQDPVQKWQFKQGDMTKFEVWPLGVATQTVRFQGQRKLSTLRSAGSFSTSLTLDLDDRLVALSIAVDLLTSKEDPSAKAKSERLQALWTTLRAAESKSTSSFSFGAPRGETKSKVVPITVG